jgi:hypothetical protein
MPHHFEFDDEHKLLLVVMEGDVDGAEIVKIDEELRARIIRMQPSAGISDLSRVRNFNVPAQVMRSAALQAAPYPAETPRFIVAPSDLIYGMSRMYELVANRPAGKLEVVRSREEALKRLSISNPTFQVLE